MRSFHAILSSFVVFALTGLGTLQGQTNHDLEESLPRLSTYDWVDQEADARGHPAVESPLLQRHIRDAVEGELVGIGCRGLDFNVDRRVVDHVSNRQHGHR